MRRIPDLRAEHGGFIPKGEDPQARTRDDSTGSDRLPPIVFGHNGLFMGSPDWWRRFEYSEDMRREVHYQEDLWTPGTFELTLNPREPTYLTAALHDLPDKSAEDLMSETESELRALDPGTDHSIAVRSLTIGAEQFRVTLGPKPATIAGYPWLGARCRDTLVSLPGLYLTTGLVEQAKGVLRQLVKQRTDGLLLDYAQESFLPAAGALVSMRVCGIIRDGLTCWASLPADDPFVTDEIVSRAGQDRPSCACSDTRGTWRGPPTTDSWPRVEPPSR